MRIILTPPIPCSKQDIMSTRQPINWREILKCSPTFLFGSPWSDTSYMTDRCYHTACPGIFESEPGKVSAGDVEKIFNKGQKFSEVVKTFVVYDGERIPIRQYAVTAGDTIEPRQRIAENLTKHLEENPDDSLPEDIEFIAVSPEKEFMSTLYSATTDQRTRAVMAVGTSTGHFAVTETVPDGHAVIAGGYISFDMKGDLSVPALEIATCILGVQERDPYAKIHVCGSPTRMFSEEEWNGGLGGMYLSCSLSEFQEKIPALGDRGKNAIELVNKISDVLMSATCTDQGRIIRSVTL